MRFLSKSGVTWPAPLPYAAAMTKHLFVAFLLASAAPSFAQPVSPEVASLRENALKDEYAWDIVEGLTTEVGQRMAGTEAEARARDWAVRKLKAWGRSGSDPQPLSAEAGHYRARQQRLDRAGGHHWRDRRLPHSGGTPGGA